MAPLAAAKFFLLLGALTFVFGSVLADNQKNASSDAQPSVIPSFQKLNIPTDDFEIKFANLHISYKMAVFPTDKGICDNAFLFVFIPIRPTSFNLREAIRSSWIFGRPSNVVVKFIIGMPKDPKVFYLLLDEQNMFGDLILYDIEDNYENLYLKVHAAFHWQQANCGQAEYILKSDDDAIVDLHRLLYWIEHDMSILQQDHPAIIFGRLAKGVLPIRTKGFKWFVSREAYPSKYYPPFVYGGAYLMSNQLPFPAVFAILSNNHRIKAFHNEDVLFTGVVANRAEVHRVDALKYFRDNRILYRRERCRNNVPLITSIYGFHDVTEFNKNYMALSAVRCSSNSTKSRDFGLSDEEIL